MTTDSVSDARLEELIADWETRGRDSSGGMSDSESALRELRSLRARVAVLESYFGVPGTTGKLYESSLDALRARHKEAVHVLKDIRIRLHAAGRRPETCYEMSEIDAFLAGEQP